MRLTTEQVNILQEELCAELVEILMDERHYTMQEALGFSIIQTRLLLFKILRPDCIIRVPDMCMRILMKN